LCIALAHPIVNSERVINADFDTNTTRGLEASPLVIDGIIYSTTSWRQVFAHNGANGELPWHCDPKVPKAWGVNACCDAVNRGVAAWGGGGM
jgi:quinohemoprotein ethanol dehydrogenase